MADIPAQPAQGGGIDAIFNAANAALQMSPQEQALYKMHLQNLYSAGGVNNADGSRSSLYASVQQGPDGRYYNVPTVWNGRIETQKWTRPTDGKVFDVPNQTAMQNVQRMGWQSFPAYATPEQADARYDQMHKFMEQDTAAYLRQQKPSNPQAAPAAMPNPAPVPVAPAPAAPTTKLKTIGGDQ